MAKTAKEYIATNDFEGAKERYENAPTKQSAGHWWKVCVEIFSKCAEWKRQYILDLKKRIIRKCEIIFNCPRYINDNREKCYLIRCFSNDNFIFSKVGTTTRKIGLRMREHIKAYTNHNITKIIVDRVYNMGDIPAEGLESLFRARYITQAPQAFKKNDRFFGVTFNLAQADEIARGYIGG